MENIILRFYQGPALTRSKEVSSLSKLKKVQHSIFKLHTEFCYHIELENGHTPSDQDLSIIRWLLSKSESKDSLFTATTLPLGATMERNGIVVEIGPRLNFSTAKSTNAVSICHNLGLNYISRIEVSTRYLILSTEPLSTTDVDAVTGFLYDRMTECRYTEQTLPQKSFYENLRNNISSIHAEVGTVKVLAEGESALKAANLKMGLAFDDSDISYYTHVFRDLLKRDPTEVECFDLAQSNSEHSRHWFFKGILSIDGKEHQKSLIDHIVETQNYSNANNIIKFSDNSSAIKGFCTDSLRPIMAGAPSLLKKISTDLALIFTAETHNFPTGVAPFSGATTGTGGRIRDVQSVGRGGYCIAGTAGYCVGNLNIPDYELPWENSSWTYPSNFAMPLDILIDASNGASDYGNKFGEPLICGFVRSFGMVDLSNERREWIKPIMFSGGMGCMESNLISKQKPTVGQKIIKIGGPVYRIGVGGGAASSVHVQGDNETERDFNAVQRGDAEMEQKLNRVVRACCELGANSPITSIHDQGAGGNGNVLKELVEPTGGRVYASRFTLGDPTINITELWGAEYQESNAVLCNAEDLATLTSICLRERCPVDVVGEVEDHGKMILLRNENDAVTSAPYQLELDIVLGSMPRKRFSLIRNEHLPPVGGCSLTQFPKSLAIYDCLERILRLPSVASKRYLTNKVDRCVTGLVAQQQCVGPWHTPLSDMAITAISYFDLKGIASSIGEQPIKCLVNSRAGARMTVAEMLSNLVFAVISDIKDVKCSGNWMWAAKLEGEGARLYDTCIAMCDFMQELGIALDGGKDSLSMAVRHEGKVIKAPGSLVISSYAPCPDVTKKVNPDLEIPRTDGCSGNLLFVDLSEGKCRLGGSAFSQVFNQFNYECPDITCASSLKNAFTATQTLIKEGAIRSGHDISDGGLIVCLLEMCFAGLCGIDVTITHRPVKDAPVAILFAEEVGWVLEVADDYVEHCLNTFLKSGVKSVHNIGKSVGIGPDAKISIKINSACFESSVGVMMRAWEETSFRLELLQTSGDCAKSEYELLRQRKTVPICKLSFNPDSTLPFLRQVDVAVIREEGSNGDREMAAALIASGFNVWDVTMQDLLDDKITLNKFRGVIFPGGFSYADVLGSARGWAANILFNAKLKTQFDVFKNRNDTFSLGICNGCQLMSLIGWVNPTDVLEIDQITLEPNLSERFECRWCTVKVENSNSIFFKNMGESILGVWVAHGEGRFNFGSLDINEKFYKRQCIAMSYVDDVGMATTIYPFNPNGSPKGIAGICSENGRHLAMMPHPERCSSLFQWPYIPPEFKNYTRSPWQKMFDNAYEWCCLINGI